MKKISVLGTMVSVGSYQNFINEIFTLVRYHISSYICFANVHMVMEGVKNPAFQKVVNGAMLVAPDGKPISIFLKYFEKTKQDRVCGMDILPDLLQQAAEQDKSVFFYGGTHELLNKVVRKARGNFPLLRIAGFISPPFRNLTSQEVDDDIQKIRRTAPDLVFVSLGCPKQETWMAAHHAQLGSCLLGVGQAFSVYAGVEKRLPLWMRNLSLEWMYRLYLEPSRLWRRYLFTNSYFLLLVLKETGSRLNDRLRTFIFKPRPNNVAKNRHE